MGPAATDKQPPARHSEIGYAPDKMKVPAMSLANKYNFIYLLYQYDSMVNVYIKGMDEKAYKLARMLAIQNDETVGKIVSAAIVSFVTDERSDVNNLGKALGFFGKDDKALAEERKAVRRIRKEIGEDFEKRFRKYERLGYYSVD
ncbi:hypothetical protein HZC09_06885 [Candidatus Micrarchaeota archaeon]|nr:hypothetical protein [Candidatus Micrarchaeota archaeon]